MYATPLPLTDVSTYYYRPRKHSYCHSSKHLIQFENCSTMTTTTTTTTFSIMRALIIAPLQRSLQAITTAMAVRFEWRQRTAAVRAKVVMAHVKKMLF